MAPRGRGSGRRDVAQGDDSETDKQETAEEVERWQWLEEQMKREAASAPPRAGAEQGQPAPGRGVEPGSQEREQQHWNGWGFFDTSFEFPLDSGVMRLGGSRYGGFFEGEARVFPEFATFAESVLGLDLERRVAPRAAPSESDYPAPRRCAAFEAAVGAEVVSRRAGSPPSASDSVELVLDVAWRLRCSHGHTCQEVFALRRLARVPWELPDGVLRPGSHAAVERCVRAAAAHGVCLIPFGGGTNVTQALQVSGRAAARHAAVLALDMARLDAIRWVDRSNMRACIQAGALGREVEARLGQLGLTLGHEPDSLEFSTLGGWVATKSSGMKKNAYGNIEDMLLDVRLVTAGLGTLERGTALQRQSVGPDVVQLALGSEGTLGVVTEATVRLRLKPSLRRYESFVFSSFGLGAGAMREIALQGAAPASVRLMDNTQFRMGQALKPEPRGRPGSLRRWSRDAKERLQKYYVTELKGFDPEQLSAMVLMFEGNDAARLRQQEQVVAAICARFGGLRAGPDAGRRGYFLTYMIAYLRDFGIDHGFLSESFETTVPWADVERVYEGVRECVRRTARQHGVAQDPLVGGRVTQGYDSAAAMYFYFGIVEEGLADPIATFSHIEHAARQEILRLGGSLSHHHGVGKLRQAFFDHALREPERALLGVIKHALDPDNVFDAANLGFADPPVPRSSAASAAPSKL
jgi:alkyldihydroxyacetonephosphate synthase